MAGGREAAAGETAAAERARQAAAKHFGFITREVRMGRVMRKKVNEAIAPSKLTVSLPAFCSVVTQ